MRVDLNVGLYFEDVYNLYLTIDVLMQHEFCCVNPIDRSWRT